MATAKAEKCDTPCLFVPDNVGQVLQYPVRGYGKDAGHRLFVCAPQLQRQNVLNGSSFGVGERAIG